MNTFEILLFITVLSRVTLSVVGRAKLSAVSDIPYFEHLYRSLRNKDAPSTLDPATYGASIRQRICTEITGSGFFEWYAMDTINSSEAYTELLRQPKYTDVFHQIYSSSSQSDAYKYTNRYSLRKFEVLSPANQNFYETEEHVFVCLLKQWSSNELVPYYVSKAYNVSGNAALGTYKVGRFVFGEKRFAILAEESGEAYTQESFNVELHYLRMRRDHRPAESFERDPVCKLISKQAGGNQHFRLCAIVLSSSHLAARFKYPTRVNAYAVFEDYVSFRTADAIILAVGKEYRERIVICPARVRNSSEQTRVYISRAYRSDEVFVYLRHPLDGKLYLENLTVNVGIVHEPFSHRFNFDDIEE